MTEVYNNRQQMKKERAAYREKAQEICATLTDVKLTLNGVLSNVQVTEGGAYVECILWVPIDAMTAKQAQMELPPVPEEKEPHKISPQFPSPQIAERTCGHGALKPDGTPTICADCQNLVEPNPPFPSRDIGGITRRHDNDK